MHTFTYMYMYVFMHIYIVVDTKGLRWDLVPRSHLRPFVNSLFSTHL